MASVFTFYEGQNIFVTGATGFLGKVLLEKLLRSCPDVGNIFVLVRPKKGAGPSERVEKIVSLPLFDIIRRERPETLSKIVPIAGDCAELGLGMSATDLQMLEETVSIVFHAAATVRFDDPLKSAVLMNTRGTRELLMIVRNMKKLKVFVHVSTAYCNCDRPVVEEIIYPPHANWRDMISIAEHVDEHTLNILTPKILCSHPNTYTFTKSLAEHVVKDLGENLPVVIFRPSVVISSLYDPFPGWIDNFNGPTGLLVAGGKGLIRKAFCDPNIIPDYVPVDVCIKVIILAAWHEAIRSETSQPTVYNAVANDITSITTGQMIETALDLLNEVPLNGMIWMPRVNGTTCQIWYYWNVILFHLLPGLLIDGLLKLAGHKPILVRLQRRIYVANMALSNFTTKAWVFKNDRTLWLREQVPLSDNKHFMLGDVTNIEPRTFLKNAMIGAREYLLNEHADTMPQAARDYRRMYWLDKGVQVVAVMLLLWYGYHSTLLHSTLSSVFS